MRNSGDHALVEAHLEHERTKRICHARSSSQIALQALLAGHWCRKLRERGATVCIVGEPKTPDALRNASDQFFEWRREEHFQEPVAEHAEKPVAKAESSCKQETTKPESSKPVVKRRPRFVLDAVSLLAGGTSEGKVTLSALGQYLKRTDPAFSPNAYGHSGLLDMIRTYDLLHLIQENGGHWTVGLAAKEEEPAEHAAHA